jgi:hypothetical protein
VGLSQHLTPSPSRAKNKKKWDCDNITALPQVGPRIKKSGIVTTSQPFPSRAKNKKKCDCHNISALPQVGLRIKKNKVGLSQHLSPSQVGLRIKKQSGIVTPS